VAYVFCNQCGHRNPPESNFCSSCGAPLDVTDDRTITIAKVDPHQDAIGPDDDITVSRRHAEIRRLDDGYVIVDAGSLNGTYVNQERVERAALVHGDEIQIGKFRLVFFDRGDA
jgi:pSer/pThr/pTyr-binding forkhead associated (FHA) protein